MQGHEPWPAGDPGPRVSHARSAALMPCGHEPRAMRDQGVGDMEVAAADDAKDSVGAEARQRLRDGVCDTHQDRSTGASTRAGLPDPPTIGSGPANTTAPVGGSVARFCSCVRPYLPAPSSAEWHGNGGSKECAVPASVPTVSTPMPMIGASSASHRAHSMENPGGCGPVLLAWRTSCWLSDRASQPVRYSSQPPAGSGPCCDSHCLMWSGASRKSGSAAASLLKSSTTAGAIRLLTGTSEMSSPSRPVIQCTGASKCVPVCSPVLMSFQSHAGPRSSYRLTSRSAKGRELAKGGGSWITGNVDSSLAG